MSRFRASLPLASSSCQNRRQIASAVEDADNLERILFGIVNYQVHRVRVHHPKSKRQGGEVFAQRPVDGECARRSQARNIPSATLSAASGLS